MSLIVFAFRRDSKGDWDWLDTPPTPPRNDLAGFESWRTKVWGAPAVRRLGLVLLPSLAEHDLYVENEDLDQLAAEVETLLAALPSLVEELQIRDLESVRFRVLNVAEAIRIARAEGGGVAVI